jgi:endogenous inhibitor of DNA gyrase (YacG/DUF329 family)
VSKPRFTPAERAEHWARIRTAQRIRDTRAYEAEVEAKRAAVRARVLLSPSGTLHLAHPTGARLTLCKQPDRNGTVAERGRPPGMVHARRALGAGRRQALRELPGGRLSRIDEAAASAYLCPRCGRETVGYYPNACPQCYAAQHEKWLAESIERLRASLTRVCPTCGRAAPNSPLERCRHCHPPASLGRRL